MVVNSPLQLITHKPYHPGVYMVCGHPGDPMVPAYFNGIDWCMPAYAGGKGQALAQSDQVLIGTSFYWYGVMDV
jgi:hypothetical protein